jgi:Domain of unknown function (DUF1707)
VARATDHDRDKAVGVLVRAYADGRLSLPELETRSERALTAESTWELKLQLRELLVPEAKRSVQRGMHVALAVVIWAVFSVFLLAGFVGALISSGAVLWTFAFPLLWVIGTVLTLRDIRRA